MGQKHGTAKQETSTNNPLETVKIFIPEDLAQYYSYARTGSATLPLNAFIDLVLTKQNTRESSEIQETEIQVKFSSLLERLIHKKHFNDIAPNILNKTIVAPKTYLNIDNYFVLQNIVKIPEILADQYFPKRNKSEPCKASVQRLIEKIKETSKILEDNPTFSHAQGTTLRFLLEKCLKHSKLALLSDELLDFHIKIASSFYNALVESQSIQKQGNDNDEETKSEVSTTSSKQSTNTTSSSVFSSSSALYRTNSKRNIAALPDESKEQLTIRKAATAILSPSRMETIMKLKSALADKDIPSNLKPHLLAIIRNLLQDGINPESNKTTWNIIEEQCALTSDIRGLATNCFVTAIDTRPIFSTPELVAFLGRFHKVFSVQPDYFFHKGSVTLTKTDTDLAKQFKKQCTSILLKLADQVLSPYCNGCIAALNNATGYNEFHRYYLLVTLITGSICDDKSTADIIKDASFQENFELSTDESEREQLEKLKQHVVDRVSAELPDTTPPGASPKMIQDCARTFGFAAKVLPRYIMPSSRSNDLSKFPKDSCIEICITKLIDYTPPLEKIEEEDSKEFTPDKRKTPLKINNSTSALLLGRSLSKEFSSVAPAAAAVEKERKSPSL